MDISASEMEVTLKMGERGKEAFLAALHEDLAGVPGTQIVEGTVMARDVHFPGWCVRHDRYERTLKDRKSLPLTEVFPHRHVNQ